MTTPEIAIAEQTGWLEDLYAKADTVWKLRHVDHVNAILSTLRKFAEVERDAPAMRAYYITANTMGFVNSPLWHELAEETRQTYRDHLANRATPGEGK